MVKQVIVIRKDLHMRLGKSCSQAAHASMKVLIDLMTEETKYRQTSYDIEDFKTLEISSYYSPELFEWLDGKFTKIVVSVNSEEELMDVYNKAKEHDLLCSLIEDEGNTEFHGVKTKTCCAIGPAKEEDIYWITGDLPLL